MGTRNLPKPPLQAPAQDASDASFDLLDIDRQLCFRLHAASRALVRLYRPAMDDLGITYPQFLVLIAMWQWDQDGCLANKSLKDLTRRLMLDSGTMTPLFRRLEQAGLVTKKANGEDQRSRTIDLTKKGRKLKQRAKKIPEYLKQ